MIDVPPVALLPANDDHAPFPPVERALKYPNGLLAVGGSLRPARILQAYRRGIFPWYSEGEPILWWAPDPRGVIFPERLHVARRLRRRLRQAPFRITRNQAFRDVIVGCSKPRPDSAGTWIVPALIEAFTTLHRLGYAISFECWQGDELVGGIYGLQLGRVFFGESMFSRRSDASRIALVHVARTPDIALIDCQFNNPHLARMGAEDIPRAQFQQALARLGASDDGTGGRPSS